MGYNATLEDRIDHFYINHEEITKNKEMDGVGWLINGNMCIGIYEDLLVCRIEPEIKDKLTDNADITYFTDSENDDFVSVSGNVYENDKALFKILNHSSKYTSTLPPKEPAKQLNTE